MQLNKIKGNTYFISAPTNIGVYVFKNKFCLIIDSGINNSAAHKIDDILKANGLHIKYIVNTHSHQDHCGGNNYFQENYPGTLVYTSTKEKIYMENPEIFSMILFSASPIKKLTRTTKSSPVNFTLDYGTNKINDEKFDILSLSGHCQDHIGIVTPEKVCFLGDSIFSYSTLDKYSFPFLYDIEKTIETLTTIKTVDADYFVVSHGDAIVSKDEVTDLVDKNLEHINKYIDFILELLEEPYTKEDILENIIILNDIDVTVKEYIVDASALSCFIGYLHNKGLIDSSIENGKLYYFKK